MPDARARRGHSARRETAGEGYFSCAPVVGCVHPGAWGEAVCDTRGVAARARGLPYTGLALKLLQSANKQEPVCPLGCDLRWHSSQQSSGEPDKLSQVA